MSRLGSSSGFVLACALTALGCSGSGSSGGGGAASTGTTAPGSTTSPGSTTTPGTTGPQTGIVATFSALSYNVAGLPQGISSSNPVQFTPQISPLLNAYDLVLCQEDFWYHADLEKDAQHPYESTPLTGYSTLVNDGLNRFSQSPFTDFTRIKWNQCHGLWNAGNDCLSSKGFSVARHEVGPGLVIDVYNLHADAGGSAGDEAARADQFNQLAAFMATYSAGNAVIVGGDTNLKVARPADDIVLTDFMNAEGLLEVSQVIGNIPDHIDRFFYRDGTLVLVKPLKWREADEFVDPAGNDLSDHPAIHVDFEVRPR